MCSRFAALRGPRRRERSRALGRQRARASRSRPCRRAVARAVGGCGTQGQTLVATPRGAHRARRSSQSGTHSSSGPVGTPTTHHESAPRRSLQLTSATRSQLHVRFGDGIRDSERGFRLLLSVSSPSRRSAWGWASLVGNLPLGLGLGVGVSSRESWCMRCGDGVPDVIFRDCGLRSRRFLLSWYRVYLWLCHSFR